VGAATIVVASAKIVAMMFAIIAIAIIAHRQRPTSKFGNGKTAA